MTESRTREVHLVTRPTGTPSTADFALVDVALPPLEDGQVLVRNTWLSVDPYMRQRMDAGHPAEYPLGAGLAGRAVGEVIASRAAAVPVGTAVRHLLGWREHAVVDAGAVDLIDTSLAAPEHFLGALGMPGLTAYAGLTRMAGIREGDVVYVSGAAGAVGSVAGRIARALGAAVVIGSAGGAEKAGRLVTDLGFDAGIDYRAEDLPGRLSALAPDGLDVVFDNVGGAHLAAGIAAAAPHARIALCGYISTYNEPDPARRAGPDLGVVVAKRLTLRGFNVGEHLDLLPEWERTAAGWIADGSLASAATVHDGIEHAADAFVALFGGGNTGKMLVRLG
jgi:NADPH-dependent curcumin reductase CurA